MSAATSKAIRLADLVLRFRAGEKLTTHEIARRYGVTKRTAERLVFDIDTELLPLEPVIGERRPAERRYQRMEVGR